jgi:phosphatidylglycerophosphatase A
MTPARLVASGFGVGFSPAAPGTAGSLLALLLAIPLFPLPYALPIAILIATAAGLWAIPTALKTDPKSSNDPGWVVIDEIAGQWITLLGLAQLTWLAAAAAFALFRLLDITKPGPIGWADRQHGAVGVMADDIIAGIIGALILAAIGQITRYLAG